MPTTGNSKDPSVGPNVEKIAQTSSPCDANIPPDQPVGHSEKRATGMENEKVTEKSNRDKDVVGEKTINEPLGADNTQPVLDQSEKEQSDDSQSSNALKKTATSASDKPYSIFTPGQKKFIILASSLGTFLSPLTSNIYFPALNTIASDLHVSISQMNLTITTYMVGAPCSLSTLLSTGTDDRCRSFKAWHLPSSAASRTRREDGRPT